MARSGVFSRPHYSNPWQEDDETANRHSLTLRRLMSYIYIYIYIYICIPMPGSDNVKYATCSLKVF